MNFGDPCCGIIRDPSKVHGRDSISGNGGNGLWDCYKKDREIDTFLMPESNSVFSGTTVNVFGHCHHHTPSWKTTLVAGLTNFTFIGLAVWALSKLSKLLGRNQQPQTQQTNFWDLYISSRFTKPTVTPTPDPKTDPKTDPTPDPKTDPKTDPTPDPKPSTNYDGKVEHGDNETIEGTIPASSVKYDHAEGTDEKSKKYPSEFVIYDTQHNENVDVDDAINGDIKGNKYTFGFVKYDETKKKAIYELKAVTAVKADGSEVSTKFNKVRYEVTSNWQEVDGKYQIKTTTGDTNDIQMRAIANQPEEAVSTSQLKNPTNSADTGVDFTEI